jgi:hypothetical protein
VFSLVYLSPDLGAAQAERIRQQNPARLGRKQAQSRTGGDGAQTILISY